MVTRFQNNESNSSINKKHLIEGIFKETEDNAQIMSAARNLERYETFVDIQKTFDTVALYNQQRLKWILDQALN